MTILLRYTLRGGFLRIRQQLTNRVIFIDERLIGKTSRALSGGEKADTVRIRSYPLSSRELDNTYLSSLNRI